MPENKKIKNKGIKRRASQSRLIKQYDIDPSLIKKSKELSGSIEEYNNNLLPGSPELLSKQDIFMEEDKDLPEKDAPKSNPQDYNKYYKTGTYEKRYKGTTNSRDRKVLLQTARRVILQKINLDPDAAQYTINILDYACGDGRYIGSIDDIAQEAQSIGKKLGKPININYIGSDPAKAGIENFRKKEGLEFEEKKLVQTSDKKGDERDPVESWTSTKSSSRNLTINLLSNDFGTSIGRTEEAIKKLLQGGEADMLMCMYGSFSHIGNDETSKVMSMFKSILSDTGELVMTVPNRSTKFAREQRAVNRMSAAEKKEKGIVEKGDIVYQRQFGFDKEVEIIENWYHLYTPEEISNKVTEAGFFLAGDMVHISHVKEEGYLVTNAVDDKFNTRIAAGAMDLEEIDQKDLSGKRNKAGSLGLIRKKLMPKPSIDEDGKLHYQYDKKVPEKDKKGASPQDVVEFAQYLLVVASATPYGKHKSSPNVAMKPESIASKLVKHGQQKNGDIEIGS